LNKKQSVVKPRKLSDIISHATHTCLPLNAC
jgi:hypothetical protein